MSAPKRAQESMDSDDDQSSSGSESSKSNPQLHPRKRARTSTSPSEEDEDVSDAATGSDPRLSPLTDDAMPDDDELEFRQTQIIQEKYAHLADDANVPSDHGILERVDCYNFMCHDHFSVELGPLINFITGKNGSGKSAILTALTLCLGGKASSTNRGQSLKSFIKEGKENSNIVVQIKNQGDGAYRPDVFGRSIIVERHFNKNSSGFKIKNENGRVISTKKSELDSITDYFSLQIDNPMNVLSQDSARQFLSTSSPAEKYKFFVKGVQLEQLDQDYRLIEESVDQMEEKIRNKSQDIRFLQEQRDAARRRLELSQQDDSLRERRRNLWNQSAWSQVEDEERTRDTRAEDLDKRDRIIRDEENNFSLFEPRLRAADDEIERATESVSGAERRLEQANEESASIKERLKEKGSDKAQLQGDQDHIKTLLKNAETRLAVAQENIAQENRRLAEVSDGGYSRRQEACEEAKRRADSSKEEYDSHLGLTEGLQENLRQAQSEETSAKEKADAKKRDYLQAESRLRKLQSDNGQRQGAFHDKLPALLSAIRREQSFSERPVGPVGHHVTLAQPKWSSILEQSLGSTLSSFIVTSKGDQVTLSRIMQRVGCELPIIIGKNQNIDTSPHEPDPRYRTVLRVLQIDNSMARTQLIIRHTVEQMLLIEDIEEASRVLYEGVRPKNVQRCYCINAKDKRKGFHLSYGRENAPSQSPISIFEKIPRMKSDAVAQISAQKEVVSDLDSQWKHLMQEFESARSRVHGCHQAISQHRQRGNALKVEMQRMEDDSDALQEALDKENVEDGRMDTLRATLKDAEDEKHVHEGSFNDSTAAMSTIEDDLQIIRQELTAKESEIHQLLASSRVADDERLRCVQSRRDIISEKNRTEAQIENLRQERERASENLERVKERILDYISKASEISHRVPIDEGETTKSINQKLDKLERDLSRNSEQLGASHTEIAAEATQKEAAYVQAKQQIEEHTTIVQQLKNTLHDRKKRWEIFRSHISSRAKAQFTYLLSERSFRGRLLTDHNKKLLDLQVEPDITKDDGSGRGAKTLSGGEKSFSQVCLLLALWEAMGSPIRCLDEFDVYMDPVNRKMAIDLLMGAARRSIGRQFILITPGSKVDINISPDVKVIELAEPERGQTTLAFQRT